MRIPAHRPDALPFKQTLYARFTTGRSQYGQDPLADMSAFAGGTVADGRLPDPTLVRGL